MPHVRQNNTQIKMCCCRQKIKMIIIGEIIKIVISKLFYPYRFKGHTVRYDQTWFFRFYSCPKPVQIQWLLNMFLYVKYSGLYTAQWLSQLKCIAAVRERFLTSQTTHTRRGKSTTKVRLITKSFNNKIIILTSQSWSEVNSIFITLDCFTETFFLC